MANISETELRIRLRKLESYHDSTGALVKRVGDQYEYTDDYIYLAYASALSNLSAGKITSQQDATDFQFSPYNTAGVLMAYRGFFINRSIYQSGDPTDYTWESTSGQSGYTSSGLTLPIPADHEHKDAFYNAQRYGLMAADVKAVMPKLVSKMEDDKDYETYDKDALIFVLVNAVKELEARIATLESA